jgi:hypothetical protein
VSKLSESSPREGDRAPVDLLEPYLPPKKPPAPSLKTRRRTSRKVKPHSVERKIGSKSGQ